MPTRDYDREFMTPLDFRVRRRVGFDTDRGTVTRFVVQLEYEVDGEWLEVVRFDHDPESEHGHDVRIGGVHMDVYREGDRVRREAVFPPDVAERRVHPRRRALSRARRTISQEIRTVARDRPIEPLTDDDMAAFQRAMDEQREEILAALAEDLGGDPEDYRVDSRRRSNVSE